MHEGTPVHMLAAVIGIAFSWMYWSSLPSILIRIRATGQNPGIGVRRTSGRKQSMSRGLKGLLKNSFC
jgi:hypothetical protein